MTLEGRIVGFTSTRNGFAQLSNVWQYVLILTVCDTTGDAEGAGGSMAPTATARTLAIKSTQDNLVSVV
jgi:hypothetical protein